MNHLRSSTAPRVLILLVLALAATAAHAEGGREATREFFERREDSLRRDDGWLSLVGLHRLAEGAQSLGSADDAALRVPERHPAHVGTLERDGRDVVFVAADGVEAAVDGDPVERVALVSDAEGDPTVVASGSLLFHVIERNDTLYLRVKDRRADLLETFDGVSRWDYEPSLHVRARWVRHDEPHVLDVPNVLGGTDGMTCHGEVRFTLDGTEYALEPTWQGDDRWSFMYGDATNGVESYGGGRFLYFDAPGEDGVIDLDFNQSYNPPCAFTAYSTCPMPPEGNVLPVAIRGGEKTWEPRGE